jgi:hypothetical protein
MKTHAAVRSFGKSGVAAKNASDDAVSERAVPALPVAPRTELHDFSKMMLPTGSDAADAIVHTAPPPSNRTGLPDRLKAGIEHLSGLAMDDVRVRYNSPKPAQLQAHAYAEGADIHVGPGQEKHLAHEAWHVVQQKQGRVKPTLQMKGVAINDDAGLEREADAMAVRALQSRLAPCKLIASTRPASPSPVQRRVGYEFETSIKVKRPGSVLKQKEDHFCARKNWHAESDAGHIEFVTEPLDERNEVETVMAAIVQWARELLALPIHNPGGDPTIGTEGVNELSQEDETKLLKDLEQKDLQIPLARDRDKSDTEEARSKEMYFDIESLQKLPETEEDPELRRLRLQLTAALDPEVEADVLGHESYRNLDTLVDAEFKGLRALGNDTVMTASPQATIGIALDEIATMMSEIPNTEIGEGSDTLASRAPEDAKALAEAKGFAAEAVESARKNPGSDAPKASDKEWSELQGLVALMFSYILAGQRAKSRMSNAKYIAPLMSRVDFHAMYSALAPAPKRAFTSRLFTEGLKVSENAFVFKHGFGNPNSPKQGPTVKQWIESVTEDKDLMSRGDVVDEKVGGSPSMGQKETLDTKDPRVAKGLAPLELRRIPGEVPLDKWTSLALQIFDISEESITRSVGKK